MTYTIALLPGDGVGVEVVGQARRVLDAAAAIHGLDFAFDEIPCGAQYFLGHGQDWPDGSAQRCADADALLLGAIGWPAEDGSGTLLRPDGKMAGWSAIVGNRIGLDLYANVRPAKLLPGVRHLISGQHRQVWKPEDVDILFFRENTEDLYCGIGGKMMASGESDIAIDTRIVTRPATERIVRRAFEAAMRPNRVRTDGVRRVSCVVKDNILHGCRLFVRVLHEVGAEYSAVEREVVLVDAFTQWLVRQPEHYDVVVAPNMFGDIITELAAALQGGMGMAVGCNIGDRHAMFEPIHGAAPKHVGKDRVNPMAAILAAAEMLMWLGERHGDNALLAAAANVQSAVRAVLRKGEVLTYDLVGADRASSASAVTTAIIAELVPEGR
jgi:3-isopropylmalate dehydrogenase